MPIPISSFKYLAWINPEKTVTKLFKEREKIDKSRDELDFNILILDLLIQLTVHPCPKYKVLHLNSSWEYCDTKCLETGEKEKLAFGE